MKHSAMKLLFALALTLVMVSCNPDTDPKATSTNGTDQALLLHDVYLDLKEISDEDKLMVLSELNRLSEVEGVLSVQVGERAETGDARLNKDYDVALHVGFASEDDLKVYAKASLHLEVRANIKDFLAGPPMVYDYWVK